MQTMVPKLLLKTERRQTPGVSLVEMIAAITILMILTGMGPNSLLKPPAKVVIAARNEENRQLVVREIEKDGGSAVFAVAIVARNRSGSFGTYGELPDLKFLGGDSLVVGLNDHDFV
jgi:hypothetical protein